MKLKTLLLSSAAAFAFVGAAQAADLSVAEPVESVRVCDAFGAGYWYIPGSDTCLKIGGHVRMDITFGPSSNKVTGATHSASWAFVTDGDLQVSAKSMTEYGPLTAYIELESQSNNAQTQFNQNVYSDDMYLSLGMLLVGRTASIYHYSGGLNFDGNPYEASDVNPDQVRLTWAMSGFGLQLAIEDPRDRWGSSLSTSYSMPDIVGALSWSAGNWSANLAGGFAETTAGSGFGARIGMTWKLDSIAPGDQFLAQFAWAQSEASRFGADGMATVAGGSVWSAVAAFQHFWAPNLSSAVTFQYADESGTAANNGSVYSIAGNLVWSPVTNFLAGIEGTYQTNPGTASDTWGVKIRLERDW